MPSSTAVDDKDLQQLGKRLEQARGIFERQSRRIEDLEHEADEAGLSRDKALYWLWRFCEAAKREGWPLSDEAREVEERALDCLFDNNIYVGLPEPDEAILRLMAVVALDEEGK